MTEGYSIWVLEFGHVENPESGMVYGEHNKGSRRLPYGYVYVRGNGHHALIDVGCDYSELARRYNVMNWRPPAVVLAEVGARPEDIDTVFVTHAHYDHFGNTQAFPNATFYMQARELTEWVRAIALPAQQTYMNFGLDPEDILRAVDLARTGRLKLVEGDVEDVLPGINLWAAHDSHTFGSMFVDVQGESPTARYIMAGDNVYVYENIEGVDRDGVIRPVGLAVNTVGCIRSIVHMLDVVGQETKRILPVHEDRLPQVFPSRTSTENLAISEVHLRRGDTSYMAS
jgi:glyoxylase-like metal-dependent hydrolase (beta-lactamase superfamily II)